MALQLIETKGIGSPLKTYWFIHGIKYVGKSTLFSKFPRTLYITTEQRHEHIVGIKYIYVKNWEELQTITKALGTDKFIDNYDFIVIDVIDATYYYAFGFKAKEKEWKDGFKSLNFAGCETMVDGIYKPWYMQLLSYPYGYAFISHTKIEDVEKFTQINGKVQVVMKAKATSGLHKRARAIIMPPIAITGHMKFEDIVKDGRLFRNIRVIDFTGSDIIEAGDGLGVMPKKLIVPKDISRIYPMIEGYFNKKKELVNE